MELRTSIQESLAKHVYPRHEDSKQQKIVYKEGEKSIFLSYLTRLEIENIIVAGIGHPTYAPIKHRRDKTGTYDYTIIKTYVRITLCTH